MNRQWLQPRLQLRMINTRFTGGLVRIRASVQGVTTQSEGLDYSTRTHSLGGGYVENEGI